MKSSPDTKSQADPKRLKHAVEYYCTLVFLYTLALVPIRFASWVGNRLGDLFCLVAKRRHNIVRDQVREILKIDGKELDAFVKRNFRHYGKVLVEFAILLRMKQEDFIPYIDLNGLEQLLAKFRSEGKGSVGITMHFGNWEWANVGTVMAGGRGGSIARPLDNPRVNEFVRRIRERNGQRILDKQGALRKALGILRENGAVCVLNDQDAGPTGLMSPFLGKPASTLTLPIELAIRTGAPFFVAAIMRNESGTGKRFSYVFSPVVFRSDPEADTQAEIRRFADGMNEELGKLIMKAPDQWFWIHRRWKSDGKQ